jgi:hypothetical protein
VDRVHLAQDKDFWEEDVVCRVPYWQGISYAFE